MAGSTFKPMDLVPSSIRPRLSPKSRGSLVANAQHGGAINNKLLPHNLTAYQASFLHNFEDVPSASSPGLHFPQEDSYRQALFNEGYQSAIKALTEGPDNVVLHQLAQSRSVYSSKLLAMTVPDTIASALANQPR